MSTMSNVKSPLSSELILNTFKSTHCVLHKYTTTFACIHLQYTIVISWINNCNTTMRGDTVIPFHQGFVLLSQD